MDLGEVGLLLVTRGEEEARQAIEDYVRASDDATRALEANAQKLARAEEARERNIQRQIKSQMELVREASNLRRAYEDLSASFSVMEKAHLDYYRTEQMLNAALKANVISETEYARVMELVTQRLMEAAAAVRIEDEEARLDLQKRANDELMRTKAAYDSVVASVDPAYAANLKYAESLQKINNAAEINAITEQQRLDAIRLIDNELQKDLNAPRVKQMERERDEAQKLKQAHAQLVAEYARLTASVNPAVRAQQIYDGAIKTLDRSLKAGIITQQQYNTTLADVHTQMERAGHTVNQFGQVMTTSERSFAKFARGGIQQLGYQVGDFAVQVQGGTSVLVAFGQQASQLAGIFGAAGAVVGAGIAIISALANAYFIASGEGKKLDQVINDMDKSFGQLNDTLDELKDNEFAKTFGDMSSSMRGMTEAALELDSAMALGNMMKTFEKLKADYIDPGFIDKTLSFIAGIGDPVTIDPAQSTTSKLDEETRKRNFEKMGFDMGYDTFVGYQRAIDQATQSGDLDKVTELLTQMFVDAAPDIYSAQQIIASGGYDMLDAYRKIALAVAEANQRLKEYRETKEGKSMSGREQDRIADEALIAAARQRQDDIIFARNKAFNQDRLADEMLIATAREVADREAESRYKQFNQDRIADEKLIATAKEVAETEAQARVAKFRQDRYADDKLVTEAIEQSLWEAYKNGEDLSKVDTASGIDAAAVVAERLARMLGISLSTAQAIVGLGNGRTEEIIYDPRDPRYDPEAAKLGRTKAIMDGAPIWTPPEPEKDKKSGGSGSKRDPMTELRAQIKLEQEYLNLSKERRRIYQALGDDRSKYSEEEIAALEAEIKAIEKKQRAIEDLQSVADTMESSFTQGIMSMVDGTATVEDAFREMARSVIAQLYEIMAVQQIVGQWDATTKTGTGLVGVLMKGITGMVGATTTDVAAAVQANGGVWENGSQINAFETGGIVQRPTSFEMSGGRKGLMGEAGPEAILPLKRTSSGKLGVVAAGGGTKAVTEHTHFNYAFNITGSDADTVRREIDKAIPRIAEVSKASVMDARRRGGKMRASFGG